MAEPSRASKILFDIRHSTSADFALEAGISGRIYFKSRFALFGAEEIGSSFPAQTDRHFRIHGFAALGVHRADLDSPRFWGHRNLLRGRREEGRASRSPPEPYTLSLES